MLKLPQGVQTRVVDLGGASGQSEDQAVSRSCLSPSRSSPPTAPPRRGRLATPHGVVETPAFMPVGTLGAVKGVHARRSWPRPAPRSCSSNLYHLALRPGDRRGRAAGRAPRLHRLARADPHRQRRLPGLEPLRPAHGGRRGASPSAATSTARPCASRPRGSWTCRSGWGSTSPWCSTSARPGRSTQEAAAASWERTLGLGAPRPGGLDAGGAAAASSASSRGASSATCASGRRRSSRSSDFDGYAIGGVSVGEPAADRHAVVEWTAPVLPADRPRYLMGVGYPEDILHAVAQRGRPLRLRAAGAQRPARRAVHPRAACSRSRTPATGTTRGRSIRSAAARPARGPSPRLPAPPDARRRADRGGARAPSTTCAFTLTSWRTSGKLSNSVRLTDGRTRRRSHGRGTRSRVRPVSSDPHEPRRS